MLKINFGFWRKNNLKNYGCGGGIMVAVVVVGLWWQQWWWWWGYGVSWVVVAMVVIMAEVAAVVLELVAEVGYVLGIYH